MTIEINISVKAATLVLTQNSGNLRADAGTGVCWTTADPKRTFTLEFFTLSNEGGDSPFECGTTCAKVSCKEPFKGVLKTRVPKGDVGAYKYNVTSGSLALDPIVVVGSD
jgi:hypothetical protein